MEEESILSYSREELEEVLNLWPLGGYSLSEQGFIQGSPERSRYSRIVQKEGAFYLLESFPLTAGPLKNRNAQRCCLLEEDGFPVSTPLKGVDGEWLQEKDGALWMLSPYHRGIALNRKRYWQDRWRGEALGTLISRLAIWDSPLEEEVFDQKAFIEDLTAKLYKQAPDWLQKLEPVMDYVNRKVLPFIQESPLSFNHGDPHPLNIVWGEEQIQCLVDWEFAGLKPLFYDAALAMGCVGSEGPEALTGPFNRGLFQALAQSGHFEESRLNRISDLILASRFSWLNEWMRHQDRAMQEQEVDYMLLLMQ